MASQNTNHAIEVSGLRKSFGGVAAVDGVDFSIEPAKVLGLLGPNGAGKTTVVKMLATLLKPDGGTARICGFDVASEAFEVRQLIGMTGQYASIDADLSGFQNLRLIGRLVGLSRGAAKHRAEELIEEAGLSDAARRPAKTYSGGMRRRLDLAASLVSRPAVVFLDEPTTGLDPARRGETWDMVRSLAAQGSAVLLTTQYLEEAGQLADDIVVIDSGKVIAYDTPENLKRRLGTQALEIAIADPGLLVAAGKAVHAATGVQPVQDAGAGRLYASVDDGAAMPAVIQRLGDAQIEIKELALRLPSLDDVFLALTGRGRPSSSGSARPKEVSATSSEGVPV